MRSNIRVSGVEIIGNIRQSTHFCQFYQKKEDLLDLLIPYFKAGLENNEFCLWIISKPLNAEEAEEALKRAIPDFDVYLEKGQVELISCVNWYLKEGIFNSEKAINGWVEKLNKALAIGFDGLRAAQDTCWLKKEGWTDFINYEKRVDSIISRYPVIALCTYSIEIGNATDIIDIAANHQFALIKREGKWEKIESSGQETITEIRSTEELCASEEHYRSLYENSLDGILLTSPDGSVLSANPQACYLFGMTEDEIIQTGREGLVVMDEKLAAALEERELVGRAKAELTFRRKDGSTFVGETSSSLFTDADGSIKTSMIIRDITGNKLAEQALRKSEERYRMLFTHMTDGFGLVEVIYNNEGKPYDYRYLEINPAFGQYLGVEREQILGRTMLEVFPNVSPTALEKYHETAVSGQPVHFEIFSQVANKYLDIYVFSPEKGKLALILRDITGRKHLEEKTRQRAEEMETIMEVAPVSILIGHDPQGNNITGNRMANELFNAESGENISANLTQSVRFFRKDHELTADELPMQEATLKNTDVRDVEIDVLMPGEKWRAILASASPLHDVDGCVRGSVGAFIDITERKEAEIKLKETLNNLEKLVRERTAELEKAYNSLKESEKGLEEAQKMAHIGNWEWGIVTEESYWSDELDNIFGRNLQDPHPTYEEFLNYVHPSDREYVYNTATKAMKGKPYSINYRIIRADGEERTVHMQSEVIFDDKNTPVRIKGIVQDITERKKAEEALTKMEKIRIKEIHHRIKNNLQVISSLLDLQAETFSHLEVCKVPEVVKAFMESQSRIISMALIHEELYKGDKIDTLDFAAYLRKLTTDLFNSYNLGNKEISFNLELEQVYLGMDTAIPLGIIVNELVSNSFKHAFPARREGEIRINLRRAEDFTPKSGISCQNMDHIGKKDFHYVLEVSDNGKGIPEEIDFENSSSLGLQLVNILVEQIDGCIELKRDHGTKFTIWFNDINI
ncbi:MAG: MEDS domain-containing protein [Methanosarcina sp.]